MFDIFFYGERIALERINPEGVYMMATTYIDIFFTTGLMCLPGQLARASRKKDKQRETENRHMQKEGI